MSSRIFITKIDNNDFLVEDEARIWGSFKTWPDAFRFCLKLKVELINE